MPKKIWQPADMGVFNMGRNFSIKLNVPLALNLK